MLRQLMVLAQAVQCRTMLLLLGPLRGTRIVVMMLVLRL